MSFELQNMDVCTQSQAWLQYLCMLLQYWEDEVAVLEGALFGGHIWKPSALVEYIIFRINLGLDAGFQIEWPSIVGSTPWLAAQQHMSDEEFKQFYSEKVPGKLSKMEQATEDIWRCMIEESVVRELGTQSVAAFWATPSPPGRGYRRPIGRQAT